MSLDVALLQLSFTEPRRTKPKVTTKTTTKTTHRLIIATTEALATPAKMVQDSPEDPGSGNKLSHNIL